MICLMSLSHLPLFLTNFVIFENLWFINVDFFVVFCILYVFCKISLISFIKWLVTCIFEWMNWKTKLIINERGLQSLLQSNNFRGSWWIPWAEARQLWRVGVQKLSRVVVTARDITCWQCRPHPCYGLLWSPVIIKWHTIPII